MTITNEASGVTSVNATSATVNKPAAAIDGDLWVLMVAHRASKALIDYPEEHLIPVPDITNPIQGGTASGNCSASFFLHEFHAGSPASVQFDFASTADRVCVARVLLRGVDLTDPIDGTPDAGTSLNSAGIDPEHADSFLIGFAANWESSVVKAFTPPSGMAELLDQGNVTLSVGVATEQLASGGATGAKNFAITPTGGSNVHALIAFNTASTGGNIRVWDGSDWSAPPVPKQVWDGAAWL